MAKEPDLIDMTSPVGTQSTYNTNNQRIKDSFDNTISRDGSTPNEMGADFDLNSNDLLNGKDADFSGVVTIQGTDILEAATGVVGEATIFNTTNRFSGDNSTVDYSLSKTPVSISNTYVYIEGAYQQKNTYTLLAGVITFNAAPPLGTNNIEVIIQESVEGSSDIEQFSYDSRASFVTAVASGLAFTAGNVVTAGGSAYEYDGVSTAISDLTGFKPFKEVTPQHWGLLADKSTGHTSKFQGALDYCKANSVLLNLPAGEYLLQDEIEGFYAIDRLSTYGLVGEGRDVVKIYYDFDDSTKTVLNFTRNEGDFQDFNQTDKTIKGFSIFRSEGSDSSVVGPCLLDVSGLGNSIVSDVYLGNSNNTHIRMSRNANLALQNVYSNEGGYSFPTYDTAAMTVAGTAAGNTLTITGGTPAHADHVGMVIYVSGGGATRPTVFTIAAAPTTGSYTTTETLPDTLSGATFVLGAPLVTGSSGGTTLTSSVACFNSDQVGLFGYVHLTSGGIQRVQITSFTNNKIVEITCDKDTGDPLSTAATLPANVSGEFIVANWDISDRITRGTSLADISNDIRFDNCSIHRGAGVALVAQDMVRARFPELKIHGEGDTDYQKTAIAAVWTDDTSFTLDGMVDSNFKGMNRFEFFNVKGQGISIPAIFTTLEQNATLFNVATQTSEGFIDVGSIRGSLDANSDIVTDPNTVPRLEVSGAVDGSYFGGDQIEWVQPRKWATLDGDTFEQDSDGITLDGGTNYLLADSGTWTPILADNETAGNEASPSATFARWTRQGRIVSVNCRMVNIDTTGLTGGDTFWIRGLPFTSTSNGSDRFTGAITLSNVTFSGCPAVQMVNSDVAIRVWDSQSGGASGYLTVAALTSGTADLNFSFTYHTAN